MPYRAPVQDMLFVIEHLAGLDAVARLPGFEEATPEMAAAVLGECARFNEGVLAPLNAVGDQQPSSLKDGKVSTTPGFKDAFRQYVEGGWQGLGHPTAVGGQGLPKLLSAACQEMLNSANLSFALCPLLTDGAIDALLVAGSDAQQQKYVPRLPTAPTGWWAPRCSSPTGTTTWRTTSSTWCWPGCPGPRRG